MWLRVVRYFWFGFLLIVLTVLACLLGLSFHPLFGYQSEFIVSGSMEPALPKGSAILSKRLLTGQYRVGDIVTFRPPLKNKVLVTHRLTAIYLNSAGAWVAESKGDANTNGDPWTISLGAIYGKKVITVPLVGYLIMAIKTQIGFLVFILLSFLFIVTRELFWLGGLLQKTGTLICFGWRAESDRGKL